MKLGCLVASTGGSTKISCKACCLVGRLPGQLVMVLLLWEAHAKTHILKLDTSMHLLLKGNLDFVNSWTSRQVVCLAVDLRPFQLRLF